MSAARRNSSTFGLIGDGEFAPISPSGVPSSNGEKHRDPAVLTDGK
jgi:hypothetical protein